ncbi:MAG: hypothetical protein J5910_00415 [Lachnospiraceae bacterium]|nr:hypothetical protein [Lachnospiraceae bacterium]
MNTEIFDYIRTLARKEFFIVSLADVFFSLVIIICGLISLSTGATTLLYTLMFASATALLGFNSYRCFKRGSRNGWAFAILAVMFAAITGICIYALIVL